jgi:polar amino acid transport system substrate-binding protein
MAEIQRGSVLKLVAAIGVICTTSGRALASGDHDDGPVALSKVLTICAIPGSMPRIDKTADGKPVGLDVAVVERLAKILKRPIEFHWCASAQCAWNCLPAGRCDVVIGQPQGSGPAREVAWSVPYAAAQFSLVVPSNSRTSGSLADFRGKRVGIVTGTVAISEKDHSVIKFKSREELLSGFAAAALDTAFVDADFAMWYLHQHPQLALQLLADYVPRERWNMALAVRATDAQLLIQINRALGNLTDSGELQRIYNATGVLFHPPFSRTARREIPRDTWRSIRERGELIVSMDPTNLPYSSAKSEQPGFDLELARALANRLHVKLRVEWLNVQHQTAVGQLLERQCDLIFGEAIAPNVVADDEELRGKLLYSQSYYRTGYVLVQRKNGPHVQSLADLKGAKSQRLGTEAGSVADYTLRQRGFLRRLYRNQLATLNALNNRDIDHAYLWANVVWTLHTTPEWNLEVVPNYVLVDFWDIAIAMDGGDHELKRQVDLAIAALIKDGTVAHMLARYYMPYYAPTPEPMHGALKTNTEPIHHHVADRGLEPQLQKVQTSKHTYSGLSRIRAAGELVVGLDQNNIPYSTAHPEPAGFEYEIAGLLAKELGVRLRVYWAYSSHDSYPSKLSKGLCDVLLGVIPDDRFAQRVQFSRPYYIATYQMVTRTGRGAPLDTEPIGVEEGLALRGLQGRAVKEFPSTELILKAVAEGRIPVGYVVSTRASWLANQAWPDRLVFRPGPENLDRFPVSAAVRKSDGDLNEAIDRAWDVLDRTGKLAQVFARWHVPYKSLSVIDPKKGTGS